MARPPDDDGERTVVAPQPFFEDEEPPTQVTRAPLFGDSPESAPPESAPRAAPLDPREARASALGARPSSSSARHRETRASAADAPRVTAAPAGVEGPRVTRSRDHTAHAPRARTVPSSSQSSSQGPSPSPSLNPRQKPRPSPGSILRQSPGSSPRQNPGPTARSSPEKRPARLVLPPVSGHREEDARPEGLPLGVGPSAFDPLEVPSGEPHPSRSSRVPGVSGGVEPLVTRPSPGPFRTAGPLTLLALAVVTLVGAVFVGGTRHEDDPDQVELEPVPAGSRPPPVVLRSWQDRYRAAHPELLVGSPRLPRGEPELRARARRIPRAARLERDAVLWTPERAASLPLPGEAALPPNTATPSYEGLPASGPGPSAPMVVVTSLPPGARVEIDGVLLGLTPWIRPRPAEATTVSVTLRLPGYLPFEAFLREAGDDLRLEARLQPDPNADPRLRGERSP